MKRIIIAFATVSTVAFVSCRDEQFKAAQMQNQYGSTTSDEYMVSRTIGNSAKPDSLTYTMPVRTQTVVVQKPVVVKQTRYVSTSSQPAKRKGWSRAAKGAVIGAGTGAVVGAVVSKDGHRVKGAVIGGVLGAGGGYVIGRHLDKKHGRY
ncbi:MAG: hypothetical protein C4308_00545 [Chitinophagaceae bacterium]